MEDSYCLVDSPDMYSDLTDNGIGIGIGIQGIGIHRLGVVAHIMAQGNRLILIIPSGSSFNGSAA